MAEEQMKKHAERVVAINKDNITFTELDEQYTDWAKTYDSDGDLWGYVSPKIAGRVVAETLGDNKDLKILDVATGTGLTGKYIYDHGYHNMDATDVNTAMLDKAKERNIFKKLFQANLSEPLDVPENSYDVITFFGTLIHTHIKLEYFTCFREFVRTIKPGGYFIAGIVKQQLRTDYRKKVEEAFQGLVDEGLWELVANKEEQWGSFQDELQKEKSTEQIWIYRIK